MRHGRYPFIAGFLTLHLVLYGVFVVSPFVQAFNYSLTDWTGVSPDFGYVGLTNFKNLLDDTLFLTALRNNLVLLVGLPLLTVLLVRGIRGSGFYKLAFFLPQVLSVSVIAVIWSVIMDPTPSGMANSVLGAVGIDAAGWLADPNLALWCVLWVLVWGSVGFYLVLFNAAMSSIPRDIFEAALIDGAGRSSTFFRVTMPLLWDTIQTSWVYLAILALDVYALVVVMTAGPGGPDNSTQVISLQIAQNGFQFGRAGYASAMGVVLFSFTLIIAAVMLRITRRERIEF